MSQKTFIFPKKRFQNGANPIAKLISKWLGGWAGLLPTIFRRLPTNKWMKRPSKTKTKQGKARRAKGKPTPSNQKIVGRSFFQPRLR